MHSITKVTNDLRKDQQQPNSDELQAKWFELNMDSYLHQGDEQVEQNRYDQAIAAYSAALEMNPHSLSAYLKRSKAYQSMGNLYAAKWDCLHALWLDASERELQDWLRQLIPSDFTSQTFLDEQLVLFKNLLLETVQPEDRLFVQGAHAIFSGNFDHSWDSELTHSSGYNLLHLAVCIGDQPLVEALVKRGAQVNGMNLLNQVSPLFIAAHNNHVPLVSYLVQHADVNQADVNEVTPLFIAACNGHFAVVKYLVEHGHAVVEQAVSEEITPLSIAAYNGHLEIVKYLVEHGHAKVDQTTSEGVTPLCFAAQNGHFEVVKYLVEHGHAAVNQANSEGATPLCFAAQSGYFEVVKYLVKHGHADVNQADFEGITPLFIAAQNGHFEVVKYLVEHGHAAVNQANSEGESPLYIAACNGYLEVVQYLLSQQADVYQVNNQDRTALHVAIKQNQENVIKLLLIAGALAERSQSLVSLLLLKDKASQTPLDYAAEDIQDELQEWGQQRWFLANTYQFQCQSKTHFAQHNRRFFAPPQKPLADCDIQFSDEPSSSCEDKHWIYRKFLFK